MKSVSEFLVIFFPLIPFIYILITLFAYYFLRRDISKYTVIFSVLSQIAAGFLLIYYFRNQSTPVYLPLSTFDFTILFRMDNYKIYFLISFLIPCVFFLFNTDIFKTFYSKIIFFFYTAGCSGIIVTGDMFNFFVFYEMMIMAAYVLITVKNDYFAGIKYMLFGALSSVFFLAGIILWFSMGEYFAFTSLQNLAGHETKTGSVLMILFSTAFFIKSGFFPVSSWPATCHSATNRVVSTFLSSFTIFSGIYGLLYLVVIPSHNAGYTFVFDMLRIISVITILSSSFFLLFETDFKRCIAGSTVFSIGFVGMCFSYNLIKPGLTYMLIHAVYKSVFFLINEHLQKRPVKDNQNANSTEEKQELSDISKLRLQTDKWTYILLHVCIFFTAGFFPALTYFIKGSILTFEPSIIYIFYPSMFFILLSFFKFSIHPRQIINRKSGINRKSVFDQWTEILFYSAVSAIFLVQYLNYDHYMIKNPALLAFDFLILFFVFVLKKVLHKNVNKKPLTMLYGFDRKYIFKNLNGELFYVCLIFMVQLLYLSYLNIF